MLGTKVGQQPLAEVEKILQERGYSLAFHTPNKGLSVLISSWKVLYPPVVVSVTCHGQECYGVLYDSLVEVDEKEPYALSRFEFVENLESS
jgi:hypothetical protein